MKNLSESGGMLLPYLEKGLLYNSHFNGVCIQNTQYCSALESKAAYEFLSVYVRLLLDKVYGFDLQFFLPFSAGVYGHAQEGVYSAYSGYLSRYMELQRDILGLLNHIKVTNVANPADLQSQYYEAKLTAAVMLEVAKDIQRIYYFNAFYRDISVVDLVSAANNLSTGVNVNSPMHFRIDRDLKEASAAINEFNRITTSYVYRSDTTIDCSLRK